MPAHKTALKIACLIVFSSLRTEPALSQNANSAQIWGNHSVYSGINQLGNNALRSAFGNASREEIEALVADIEEDCGDGDAAQCVVLAKAFDGGDGVEGNDIMAFEFYQQACDTGDSPESCERTQEISALIQEAATFQSGCDQGRAEDCNELGDAYNYGSGTDGDDGKRFAAYEKACDLGSFNGCRSVGYAYQNGRGVDPDFDTSMAYFERACELEGSGGYFDSDSCAILKVQRKDRAQAAEYSRACLDGSAEGCYQIGIALVSGEGVIENEALAQEVFAKACSAGHAAACDLRR